VLSIAWGVGVVSLWNLSGTTVTRRVVFLLLAVTLFPLIAGAIHTRRLQARHGLRCPDCGHGLGGGDGKVALRTGKCPDCGEHIIEAET